MHRGCSNTDEGAFRLLPGLRFSACRERLDCGDRHNTIYFGHNEAEDHGDCGKCGHQQNAHHGGTLSIEASYGIINLCMNCRLSLYIGL